MQGIHRRRYFTAQALLVLTAMLALASAGCYQQAPPRAARVVLAEGPDVIYDYAEARRHARAVGRPMLVLFINHDCHCCRYMLLQALRVPSHLAPMAS